jgi:hypothetical protein
MKEKIAIVGGREFGKKLYESLIDTDKEFISNPTNFKATRINKVVLVEGIVNPVTAKQVFLNNKDSIYYVLLKNPWNPESREFYNLVLESSTFYSFNVIVLPEIYGDDIDFGLIYELFNNIKNGTKKEIEYKNDEKIYVMEYTECVSFVNEILKNKFFKGGFKIQGESIYVNDIIKELEKRLNKKSKICFIKTNKIEFSSIGFPLMRIRNFIKGELYETRRRSRSSNTKNK